MNVSIVLTGDRELKVLNRQAESIIQRDCLEHRARTIKHSSTKYSTRAALEIKGLFEGTSQVVRRVVHVMMAEDFRAALNVGDFNGMAKVVTREMTIALGMYTAKGALVTTGKFAVEQLSRWNGALLEFVEVRIFT